MHRVDRSRHVGRIDLRVLPDWVGVVQRVPHIYKTLFLDLRDYGTSRVSLDGTFALVKRPQIAGIPDQ